MKNIAFLTLSILMACGPSTKKTDENTDLSAEATTSGITLTKAPKSPQFPDATLTKLSIELSAATDTTTTVNYSFGVDNYQLGIQTTDAATRGLANSGEGQHIHFIVNNGPYSAHYMPGVVDELAAGNYVVLAFLSRSYHESVKSPGAYYIENLAVGNTDQPGADLDAPHMFFSRPKGTYSGENTKKLMLDFYLVNTDISINGNNIRVTINGNGEGFLINEWVPYYLEGLPMGEVNIKLELLDASGNLVDSPFNPVERTVTLTE